MAYGGAKKLGKEFVQGLFIAPREAAVLMRGWAEKRGGVPDNGRATKAVGFRWSQAFGIVKQGVRETGGRDEFTVGVLLC